MRSRGMPSARGTEWKKEPGDGANFRFYEGYEKIQRNPDGSMKVESDYVPVVQDPQPPESCNVCPILDECPDECFRRSRMCFERHGLSMPLDGVSIG